jgi:hypothetical protein
VLARKFLLVATLLVGGIVYLGWLPKDRADSFVRLMVAIFVLGFAVRVGGWLLAHP